MCSCLECCVHLQGPSRTGKDIQKGSEDHQREEAIFMWGKVKTSRKDQGKNGV